MSEPAEKPNILGNIRTQFADLLKRATADTRRKAFAAYQTLANKIRTRQAPGNQLMNENSDRLVNRLFPKHIGRLIMYFYDPKTKDKLPYYDRFPLVIPIEFYPDGFLGLNLHYLPQAHRARLMDVLYNTIYTDKYLNEKKIIVISYKIMKNVAKTRLFEPCIKRYLYGHVRSKFLILDPNDWQTALFLPTERFEKQNMSVVHADSLAKIGQSPRKRK